MNDAKSIKKVMRCLEDGRWRTVNDVVQKTNLSPTTVRGALIQLVHDGKVEVEAICGNAYRTYRKKKTG